MRIVWNKKTTTIFSVISLISLLNALFFIFSRDKWAAFFHASGKPGEIWDAFALVYLVIFLLSLIAYYFYFSLSLKTLPAFIKKIWLVFTPTQLFLAYGLDGFICDKANTPTCYNINHFIPFSIVLYFLLLGAWIIYQRLEKGSNISIARINNYLHSVVPTLQKNWLEIALVAIVLCSNLGFSLYHLSQFSAVDEPLWTYERIPKFWKNLSDWEWYKTNVSDKPGITVAIISGAGLKFTDPEDYESIRFKGQIFPPGRDIRELNFNFRLPLVLFTCLMLLAVYFFIRKLFGQKISILSLILIGLSPILIGISRIINPDALLWSLSLCSLLSFMVYLRDKKNSYLYFSAFFLGLSLLTKYVANIFYVLFLALIFFEYLFNYEKYRSVPLKDYLKKHLSDYAILVFFSFLTFFLFLPAAWIEISLVLKATIFSQAFQKVSLLFLAILIFIFADIVVFKNKLLDPAMRYLAKAREIILSAPIILFISCILFVALNTYWGMHWFDFETILASPKTAFRESGATGLFFSGFYSLLFGIIPLAFLSVVAWLVFTSREIIWKKRISPLAIQTFYLIFFIFLYYFASAINLVGPTIRYQIIIFPIILILAAIGINYFLGYIKMKKNFVYPTAFFLVLLFSLYSLFSIKPFYFSYASDLLPKKYVLNPKDMGDGSYEAAQYLNGLPQPEKLGVWTDKKGLCSFLKGRCYIGVEFKEDDDVRIDYFVVSSGRENRTTNMNLNHLNAGLSSLKIYPLYTSSDWDYKIEIDGRPNNFLKVFSAEKVEHVQ